jgi:hypothetical protein
LRALGTDHDRTDQPHGGDRHHPEPNGQTNACHNEREQIRMDTLHHVLE